MQVLTSVSNKRGDLGGQVDMVGGCKFSRGEELIPVVLVVVAEHSDVCLKFLVDMLHLPISLGVCYGLLQCYLARYFRNPDGLEGSEMEGFWTMASAHVLHLPSIVVQVFKVLASSEKYLKIPKNYFWKVRCFSKDFVRFWVVSGRRNLRRRLPKQSKSCSVA